MTQRVQCILCAEQAEFVGVAECNHEGICFRCIYKMRIISKSNSCPICKFQSKVMIITKKFRLFSSFTQTLLADKSYSDILYADQQSQLAFSKLMEFKCFVKTGDKHCKHDKRFPSFAFLKKHLKDDHNRYLCDICFEKKTCVLQQQKLYSYQALTKHLQRGDIDECNNVTFLHPFCKFCNRHFFDEDEFKMHINIQHINCSICGPIYKYVYYKQYNNLENHHKISHYVCSENQCVQKKFIAFKTAEELKVHRAQIHSKGGKKVDLKQMCGFTYEGRQSEQQYIQIKDKQGVSMQNQFLSLKKTKNRALGEADQQTDALLDIREFFQDQCDEQQHLQTAFSLNLTRKATKQNSQAEKNQGKKKKYVAKTEAEKQEPINFKQNEEFFVQDLKLLPKSQFSNLSFDKFQGLLKKILKQEDIEKICEWRSKLNKRKLTAKQFVDNFFNLMKEISLKSAYQIFPHFIRTIQNEQLKDEVDKQFLIKLKSVPSKVDNLLVSSKTYGDFFKALVKQIEMNIQSRIKQQHLIIKSPIKRSKERLFQIIGVVRRLKIEQMAKFKFASNFGLQRDTMEYLVDKVLKLNRQNVQKRLNKINNDQIIDLYIFAKYCYLAINHNKDMYLQKNKIHQDVLEDFLFERPALQAQFGKKAKDMKTLEQKVEYQKQLEEKRMKNQLKQMQMQSKKRGYEIKTDYSLADKGDFPQLDPSLIKKSQKKVEQTLKNVYEESRQKPATYQKKINQMFPTLGEQDDSQGSNNKANSSNTGKKQQKKEKAWWQKINQRPDGDDMQVVNVKKKGKKKKVQWVQVKGLFN